MMRGGAGDGARRCAEVREITTQGGAWRHPQRFVNVSQKSTCYVTTFHSIYFMMYAHMIAQ